MPTLPSQVKIPDDWLVEAGLIGFKPDQEMYRVKGEATAIPLTDIIPPQREPGHMKDAYGFDRARLVSILRGIVAGDAIQAVEVMPLAGAAEPEAAGPYRYRVYDGFHRFYASVAAGFTHLPCVISEAAYCGRDVQP